MATLESITNQTAEYAKTRRAALDLAGAMQAEIEALQAAYDKRLRKAVTAMTIEHEALSKAIEGSKGLFEKTKSMTIDGIKIGFQVGKEKIGVLDSEMTIKRLEQMIEQATTAQNFELLTKLQAAYKVEYKLVDAGLKKLDSTTLVNVGVAIYPATNDVLIKPQETDTTKAVDNIIKTVLSELED